MNVENRNAYVRILSNGMPTPPFSIRTLPPRETNHEYAAEMIRYSHAQNGRPREEVEREIRERFLS